MSRSDRTAVNDDTICVCCGIAVPEGRMVCANCENHEEWERRCSSCAPTSVPKWREWFKRLFKR